MNNVVAFLSDNMWIIIMTVVSLAVLCGVAYAVERIVNSRSEEAKANSERISSILENRSNMFLSQYGAILKATHTTGTAPAAAISSSSLRLP